MALAPTAEHYIDCAFNSNDKTEAFIFTADQCLLINYANGPGNDYLIKGPMSIGDFFPNLPTQFDKGIDAAFTSSRNDEVYIFKKNIYAVMNFKSFSIIQAPQSITDGFNSLKGTIFENGIDAAFASSRYNEAYIFKRDEYALIYFAPGTTDNYIIQGPRKITLGFPSFKGTVFHHGFDAAFQAKAENEAYIFKDNTYAQINYAPDHNFIINTVTPISDAFPSLEGIIPCHTSGR